VRNPWCLDPGAVRAATAAMMASRFPYVTPSGVVGPCGPWSRQQLVDGGYAENTGLGTLADLAPQWMQAVRRHNDAVLEGIAASTSAGTASDTSVTGDLVVPVVIYLDNGSGSDLAPPPVSRQSELLVPPTTMLTAAGKQSDTPALLQRLATIVADDQLSGLGPRLGSGLGLGSRVVVVHESSRPAVEAPLGWVLSASSLHRMDAALAEQGTRSCSGAPQRTRDSLCRSGYASLADLAAWLGRPPTG
jgi:hypothetical protein